MRDLNTSNLDRSRRAITGIIIAIIVFATIFSVGVGYYVYAGQASLLAAQGAISRQGSVQGANAESLTVSAAGCSSGCVLAVNAYNSGGIPVTITAVYVTNTAGKSLSYSSSLGSEFLTSGSDLNVTLPLSLAVGEGTSSLTGCGAPVGCAIGIRLASCVNCLTSGNVYVSILTSRGNTFSAEYCPSTCSSGAGQTATNTITSATTSTSYSTSYTSTTTTLYGETSSTAISGFQAGTNSLIVSMQACAGTTSPGQTYGTTCTNPQPLAVYSSEEVILLITVTNFANVPMSVSVNYQAVSTSGSSVTAQSSSTSPPIPSGADSCVGGTTASKSISANGGEQTYTCTFIATQGTAGGTVTFLGYAVGSYSSGYVTSAEILSNPIEIGNPLSSIAGPFVGLSFKYASQGNNTFGSAVVVSNGGNSYVIFQATLENTANKSVTILEYSFLLVARVAQEHDFYIINDTRSSYTSTLSGYTCALGTNNAPTGAQCSTAQTNCSVLGNGCVPTGDTVTLNFAASDISGTSWEWQNGGGFNPPEAVTMFVIVEYDYYNAGVWHVLAQAVPFTGTYFTS